MSTYCHDAKVSRFEALPKIIASNYVCFKHNFLIGRWLPALKNQHIAYFFITVSQSTMVRFPKASQN